MLDNLPTTGWIIPPSLRNNGIHCVFVQVRKLVVYFSSRVPFSLCRELYSFSHLKQGNGVHPCMACASSHNGITKKRFLNIWMDVFGFCYLQVVLFQQWCMVWLKHNYIENWMQAIACRNVELKSILSYIFKDNIWTVSQRFHLSLWTSETLLLQM